MRVDTQPSAWGWRRLAVFSALIFILAVGTRVLVWRDARHVVGEVQTAVTADYVRVGRLLSEEGVAALFSSQSSLADPNFLGHPPGYPLLWAILFRLRAESDMTMQLFQMISDATAAVVVLLIAAELLPAVVGVLAGALVALAPQFAWNSILLLPDTLAVLPVLLAVYVIVRSRDGVSPSRMLAAGALVGLSCWLRANALLLAPFLCLVVPLLFERGGRARAAVALVGGALIVIAPLTVRNAVVFGRFIPVSLGAGQTMLEGIADYDPDGRLGIPQTDIGIMRQEAERFGRPDYAEVLFGPDAVKRDRQRLRRAFGVVAAHPIWFAGVMVRRAASMLRLERARKVEGRPPVTSEFSPEDESKIVWSQPPREMLAGGLAASKEARVSLSGDGEALILTSDRSKYGEQFVSPPLRVREDTEYVLLVPVKITRGRALVKLTSEDRALAYASAFVEPDETKATGEQDVKLLRLPFVNREGVSARVVIANGAAADGTRLELGATRLYELGPSSLLWTSAPRAVVRGLQSLFITALMLPLALAGICLTAFGRGRRTLALLLVVPAYYLSVQSALHTEYRYVLAIHHFLFVFVAVALYALGSLFRSLLLRAASSR